MYQYSLLYSLAYSHSFIRQLWYHITTAAQLSLFCPTPIITLLARRDEVVFSLFGYLLVFIFDSTAALASSRQGLDALHPA